MAADHYRHELFPRDVARRFGARFDRELNERSCLTRAWYADIGALVGNSGECLIELADRNCRHFLELGTKANEGTMGASPQVRQLA